MSENTFEILSIYIYLSIYIHMYAMRDGDVPR